MEILSIIAVAVILVYVWRQFFRSRKGHKTKAQKYREDITKKNDITV